MGRLSNIHEISHIKSWNLSHSSTCSMMHKFHQDEKENPKDACITNWGWHSNYALLVWGLVYFLAPKNFFVWHPHSFVPLSTCVLTLLQILDFLVLLTCGFFPGNCYHFRVCPNKSLSLPHQSFKGTVSLCAFMHLIFIPAFHSLSFHRD